MKWETSSKNILERKINSLIPESLLFFFHSRCANKMKREIRSEIMKNEKNEEV
jgi:hypothetical protein